MCTAPQAPPGDWHGVNPIGGMRISLPPSFNSQPKVSHNRHIVFYSGGRERAVSVGTGAGPGPRLDAGSGMGTTSSNEKLPDGLASTSYATVRSQMTQTSQCVATINGRAVQVTEYRWYGPDAQMSTTGEASALYRAVAHYLPADSQPDVFVSIESTAQSDMGTYRLIFWTASFGDAEAAPSSKTAALTALPCVPKSDSSLPTAGAVFDTALVQMLSAGSGAMPAGFVVLALKFDAAGRLAGISASESDLPDSAQRKLATLVASNLEPHDSHAASSFRVRIESAPAGFRYAVQPACSP